MSSILLIRTIAYLCNPSIRPSGALSNSFASVQNLFGVGAARGHCGARCGSWAAGGQALTCSPSASREPARTTTGRRWRVQAITRHHGDLTACSCSAITKVSEWLPRKGCGQWAAPAESKPREVLATDLAKPIASLGAPSRSQGSPESMAFFARKPEKCLLALKCSTPLESLREKV